MKFGLIAQMQAPKPWAPGENVDHRIHWDTLAEAIHAEDVGFDYYWATEHHFYEEIAHSSAPEVFLAVLAARTSRIRLGHGVVVLPCNHPVRVAERAATLDILSNGRLDLGTGRGASWYHTEAFGISTEASRAVWEESLRVICGLFLHDTFPGHRGAHYDIPERKLIPKPLQKPHPPLWVAATSQSTFASAARAGLGVLGFTAVPPEELAPAVAAYRQAQAEADPAHFFGAVPNFQVAAFLPAYCDTDDRRGRAVAGAAARWYLGDNEAPLNRVRFGPDFDRSRFAKYTDDTMVRDNMVIGGDADTCSRVVERWAKVGVDQLLMMVQCGVTSHDQVMRSLELLGTRVLPRFRDAS